jgi:hypothetical protein
LAFLTHINRMIKLIQWIFYNISVIRYFIYF